MRRRRQQNSTLSEREPCRQPWLSVVTGDAMQQQAFAVDDDELVKTHGAGRRELGSSRPMPPRRCSGRCR